jgi:hypothetical protein
LRERAFVEAVGLQGAETAKLLSDQREGRLVIALSAEAIKLTGGC